MNWLIRTWREGDCALRAVWPLARVCRFMIIGMLIGLTAPTPVFADGGTDGADVRRLAGKTYTALAPRVWPPQYNVDDEGNPVGFAYDVMSELSKLTGIAFKYKLFEKFSEIDGALGAGEGQLVPNSGITKQRGQNYLFTPPVEVFAVRMIVRASTKMKDAKVFFHGKKIGVVASNVGGRLMSARDDIKMVTHSDVRTLLFELMAGNIDALVYPEPVVFGLARQIGIEDRIVAIGEPLAEISRGLRIVKSEPELAAVLSQAVEMFHRSPDYERIYIKWYGAEKPYWASEQFALLLTGMVLAIILAGVALHYMSVVRLNKQLQNEVGERVAAEEVAVAARMSAEEANKAKSTFLAHMSHELRTPLNAIIGFSHVIKDQSFGRHSNPKYEEYGNDINMAGQHLLAVIGDILDISKIEAGEAQLIEKRFFLNEAVRDCTQMLPSAPHSCALTYEPCQTNPVFLGEERLIRQIILNLLSNAAKFTPQDGCINVAVCCNDSGGVSIVVKDTGVGIDADDIPRVLEPFGQARRNVMHSYDGTGLGLSLSKMLTELHQGQLEITSIVGEGTTVSLTFPSHRIVSDSSASS